ncbi:MAG: ATP-binding protein [Anaerolineae bacterium]
MREALVRHDEIIRDAIEGSGGRPFKYVGDAVYAVFEDASGAVAAALAAQRGLLAEDWPSGAPVRVRMAMHTGEAVEIDEDFVGPTLNRCARLVDAAHGGQTLLSLETREALPEELPDGAWLDDLAAHRLRDLARPERIFELRHPELKHGFPPLRTLDELPNNLPIRRSAFVGRSREMAKVKELLSDTSLLTLVGTGGSGKTRLALQVAGDLAHTYPDGVWFVPLGSLEDPRLVPQRVASAIGLAEEAGRSSLDVFVDYARPRRLLLVLDNCEHLIDACAELALTLIESAADIQVLATSREPLDIDGETTWRVPSMTLPDPVETAGLSDVALASVAPQYSGVRLFALRAEMADPDFRIEPDNVRAVIEICRRLDGMPLAIELAAARVRVMTVSQILERLDDRFRLLTAGRRGAVPRQRTLGALIDWSYDLLSADQAALLRRLSVFRGGWTLEAAERVGAGGDIDGANVLDLLSQLVDKSLVHVHEQEAATRYVLLNTIQEYAWERLVATDEVAAVHERFVSFCIDLAESAAPELAGPDQAVWLDRLSAEHDNFRAALAWCVREARGDLGDDRRARAALRLVTALQRYWWLHGHQSEGRSRMVQVLGLPQVGAPTPERGLALIGAGILACQQGDYEDARALTIEGLEIERAAGDDAAVATALATLSSAAREQGDLESARELAEQSLALREGLGDDDGVADALHSLGHLAYEQGDLGGAADAFASSLELRRGIGDRQGIAASLNAQASVAYASGALDEAKRLYLESLSLARALGDRRGTAFMLNNLGRLALDDGDTRVARRYLEESLALKRDMDDKRGVANSLSNLGDVAVADGQLDQALRLFVESLEKRRRLGDLSGIAESLDDLGCWALAVGRPEQGVRLVSAGERLRGEIGVPLAPFDQSAHADVLHEMQTTLGDAAYETEWRSGQQMSSDEAIAAALALGEVAESSI